MNNNYKKKRILTIIVFSSILIITPIIIGIPLVFGLNRKELFEIVFVVFGLLELLAIIIMYQFKVRRLFKTGTTNENFKKTPNYNKYNTAKLVLLSTALVNLLLSLLYFYIFLV